MATKPAGPQKAVQKQGVGQEKEDRQPWQSATDAAKDAYYSLEDRYYSLLDYLEDECSLPVYEKFVEPVESAKIPSFPVAVLSAIVIFAALFGIASLALAPNTATVTINLVSTDGEPVSEANVTLFVDNADTGARIASRTSNYGGAAVFEKVPMGVSLFVTVVAPDFKDYMQPLAPLSRAAPFAQLELESVSSSADADFKLIVRDGSNLPVLGATVTAHTVTGTLLEDGVQLTNAFGAVQFGLSTREFLAIDVEKEGFESVYGKVVDASRFLTETVTLSKKADTFKARSVRVITVASNSTGGAVSAEVSLYTVAGSELGKKRTQDGRASFDVPQGTEFYVSAVAASNDTANYFEYYSDRLVAEDDVNEFALHFVSKAEANSTNSACGTLRVYVQNESGAQLSGEVSLYLESTNAYVARRQVQSGQASFDLCANSTVYAAAYSPGYFAANALGLRPGTNALIALRAMTGSNSGSAEITALDADAKTPVSGAIISLLGSDGRFLAYPKQSTNADGRSAFFGLELGASYYAFADKPSKNARSALFTVTEGAGAKVTIVFGHSTARIAVAPVDVLTGQSVDAVATAKASGMPAATCQVRTSNTTFCELTVYSGIPVTVEVTSSGYEKLASSPFVLSESESVRYVASMLPSSLKNQFTVRYSGLFDSKGNGVSAVERGAQYDAKFIVNIPANASAYKAGFILRIGTAGFDNRSATDPLEHFVIIPKQYPQVPVNLMSYSYRPSASCTPDVRNSSNEQGYYKWAYYLLDNASGVREVLARVQVRDNAYTDELLRVSSSAWYTPSGVADSYLHIPADLDFGSANRSGTRDWCYAKSDYRDYSVRAGKSYCGTSACASLGFYDSDSNQTSQYKGIIGRPFHAEARFDLLRAVQNPRIVVFSTSQKARIHGYNVSTDVQNLSGDAGAKAGIDLNLSQFYSSALVRLNVTFSDKADFSTFYADLYDGSTRISRAYGYITQGGFGKLRIYAAPERMSVAGSYLLNVSLTDYYSSSAVEDAFISLNETAGTPFSGRKYSVLGGSVANPLQGVSGNYWMDLLATQKGAFDIVATHPDYLDARKQVVVDGTDFLLAGASDIEACGEANQFDVYNGHVLDANVSITASKSGCMNVTGFSQVRNGTGASWTDNSSQIIRSGLSYFLPLSFQSQGRITISPVSWDKACTITLAASARDGSQSTRTIAYSNCKESAFSEFLSVSPSRVSYSASNGRCNSAAVVNVSNTLAGAGTITVQAQAQGLVVESGGSNQSLSSPFAFSVPRGGKVSLLLHPTIQNYSTLITFNSTDGSRNANVTIPFDNCPVPTREAAPDILSYSPRDYAKVATEKVPVLVTVDAYAYCRIGPSNVAAKQLPYMLSQKSSSGGNYDYGIDLSYNKGSGTPFAFALGRNTAYVGCCNPSNKGGECTTANVPISFDYQYIVPTSTPTPTPIDTKCTVENERTFCGANKTCVNSACVPGCRPESPNCQAGSTCDATQKVCLPVLSASCTQDNETVACGKDKVCTSGKCVEGCRVAAPNCASGKICDPATLKCVVSQCRTEFLSCSKTDATLKCCDGLVCGSAGKCLACDPLSSYPDNGCSSSQKACTKSYSCVECARATEATDCASGKICDNNKCVAGTRCTSDAQCTSPQVCDLDQFVCTDAPLPPSSKILTYVPDENAFYLNGVRQTGASITVEVSSVIPAAGFIMGIDNAHGIGDGSVTFTSADHRLGIYTLAGVSIGAAIPVAKGKVEYVLVTYPDMNPLVLDSNSWGSGAGYSSNGDNKLKFSALPATLGILPSFGSNKKSIDISVNPKVVNTDNYAFSGGVFETTNKVFVPFNPSDVSKFDPYYSAPTRGESYTGFLFNNVMLSSAYGLGLGTTNGAPQKIIPTGFNGVNNLGSVSPSTLNQNYYVWPVHKNALGQTEHRSNFLNLDRPQLALSADNPSDPAYAVRYSAMSAKLSAAMRETNNLLYSYSQIGQMSSYSSALTNALRLAYDGGRFPDVFLAVQAGAMMHVAWLPYNAGDMNYGAAKDITPTFEYPSSLDSESTIGLLASPYQKYLLAYAGQKRNMGYFCPYPGGVCNTPETSIYVKGDKGNFYREGTAGEKAAAPSEISSSLKVISSGSGSGSAAYSNPVSGLMEENPHLKCGVSKMSRNGDCLVAGSDDACVVTASNEWVYVKSDGSRAYSVNQCDTDECKDCYGHPCDAAHVEASNFNGGDSSKGYDPYALTWPDVRCLTYRYTRYFEGECVCVKEVCTPLGCTCVCSSLTWLSESKTEYLPCGTCDATSGPNSFPSTQNAVEYENRLTPAFTDRGGASCTPKACECPDTCPGSPAPMTETFMQICVPQTTCIISSS